jgi:hypothetical protein
MSPVAPILKCFKAISAFAICRFVVGDDFGCNGGDCVLLELANQISSVAQGINSFSPLQP